MNRAKNPHNKIKGSDASPGTFLKLLEAIFIVRRRDGFKRRKHSDSVKVATLPAVLPRMIIIYIYIYIYTQMADKAMTLSRAESKQIRQAFQGRSILLQTCSY